jgi:D-alanyl-D-alanine carboxypeptidase (penicillin-binding protein 5/6)
MRAVTPSSFRFVGEEATQEHHALEIRLAAERQAASDQFARRRRAAERRRRRARIRRNRAIVAICLGVGVAVIWSLFPTGRTPASASRHAAPAVKFSPSRRGAFVLPGRLGPLPWPAKGQAAVAITGEGLMASSGGQRTVPIASLTKMMTATVVLADHPLRPGEEGPSFTMTAADADAWVRDSQSGDSTLPVQAGEVLTEHQLLEALLIPSADNVADYLATWDAGSIPAFVKKMNAEARRLGLSATTYADASGVNPASRSDAANQALLAAHLMENPVVRSVVAQRTLAFPVAGTIRNFNPALGVDGIIGVKSGYTSHAQGCLASAAYERVRGHSVLLVSVALGQPNALYGAARADEALTLASARTLVAGRPGGTSRVLGVVSVDGGSAVPVALTGPAPVIVGWPGLRVSTSLSLDRAVANGFENPVGSGSIGTVIWSTSQGVVATAPFVATAPTAAPTG